MKTMMLAAAAVLTLSVGVAYAESEGGPEASSRASLPRHRYKTPRRSRRRRTDRRFTFIPPSRRVAPGCSRRRMVGAQTTNPSQGGSERPAPVPVFLV